MYAISRKIDRIVGMVSLASGVSAAFALVLITALVFVEVLARNLFRSSTYISDEFAGYLLLAIVFLGLPYTLRSDKFVRVDLLYGIARGPLRLIMGAVIHFFSMAYVLILMKYFIQLTSESYLFQTTSIYASRTPLYIPQAVLVVGSAFLLLELCSGFLKTLVVLLATPDAQPDDQESRSPTRSSSMHAMHSWKDFGQRRQA